MIVLLLLNIAAAVCAAGDASSDSGISERDRDVANGSRRRDGNTVVMLICL